MTPALQEQLDQFIIAALATDTELGMRLAALVLGARNNVSINTTEPDVASALRRLADKKIAREYQPVVGAARWRITPYGLDVAKAEGLA